MREKGRKKFSEVEIEKIKDLLKEKVCSRKNIQRRIRDKIRQLGFYISDFRITKTEFTVEDFNELIKDNKIKIIKD